VFSDVKALEAKSNLVHTRAIEESFGQFQLCKIVLEPFK
jgi:hypothetical protein